MMSSSGNAKGNATIPPQYAAASSEGSKKSVPATSLTNLQLHGTLPSNSLEQETELGRGYQLQPNDVFCGPRGWKSLSIKSAPSEQTHRGNQMFNQVMDEHVHIYLVAKTRTEKTRLMRNLVIKIRESNGRFVRQDNNTGIWYDIGNIKAREKVGHALRVRTRKGKVSPLQQAMVEQAMIAAMREVKKQPPLPPTQDDEDRSSNQADTGEIPTHIGKSPDGKREAIPRTTAVEPTAATGTSSIAAGISSAPPEQATKPTPQQVLQQSIVQQSTVGALHEAQNQRQHFAPSQSGEFSSHARPRRWAIAEHAKRATDRSLARQKYLQNLLFQQSLIQQAMIETLREDQEERMLFSEQYANSPSDRYDLSTQAFQNQMQQAMMQQAIIQQAMAGKLRADQERQMLFAERDGKRYVDRTNPPALAYMPPHFPIAPGHTSDHQGQIQQAMVAAMRDVQVQQGVATNQGPEGDMACSHSSDAEGGSGKAAELMQQESTPNEPLSQPRGKETPHQQKCSPRVQSFGNPTSSATMCSPSSLAQSPSGGCKIPAVATSSNAIPSQGEGHHGIVSEPLRSDRYPGETEKREVPLAARVVMPEPLKGVLKQPSERLVNAAGLSRQHDGSKNLKLSELTRPMLPESPATASVPTDNPKQLVSDTSMASEPAKQIDHEGGVNLLVYAVNALVDMGGNGGN